MQQYTISVPDGFLQNIINLKKSIPANLRSNIKGWQSPQYENTKDIPWATNLVKQCLDIAGITKPLRHVWFNINGKDAHHKWHAHGGASIVGVFYIKADEGAGAIEFRNGTIITPYSGLLLIFPADIEHRVLPNKDNNTRISMAFNIDV